MKEKLSKIEVQKIVGEKYNREDFLSRNFGSFSYKEYEKIEKSKYRNKEQTANLKIYISKTPYIILITITTFFLLTFPYFNKDNPTTLFFKIVYSISFILIIISLYKILLNRKLYIQVFPNSFIFNKREILWSEILVTGKLIVHGKPSYEFLILGLDSGEILKIDINKSEIYTEDFIKIIHLNKI
ncbi:MAG: hypothetical protein CMP76_13970 [Flavobacterium sp.]|uniref:hypothetical protein n=1 Tax=Flavobacterium sp. TaxID=239 RepID=UPI000C4DD7DB|nr:hypothetical protein [Flavobacterium sp.]MBF04389.1 hypothetical protein [Flavobacterium sp.]